MQSQRSINHTNPGRSTFYSVNNVEAATFLSCNLFGSAAVSSLRHCRCGGAILCDLVFQRGKLSLEIRYALFEVVELAFLFHSLGTGDGVFVQRVLEVAMDLRPG